MAQFRATIKGQRGEASRLGTKKSGIVANINGWATGIRVEAFHIDGKDVFHVYATTGSSPAEGSLYVGTLNGSWEGPKTKLVKL